MSAATEGHIRVLSDDFIDEAVVRFARRTPMELARYIEHATIDAVLRKRDGFAERFYAGDIITFVSRVGVAVANVVSDDGDFITLDHPPFPHLSTAKTIAKSLLRPGRIVQL